MRSVGYSLETAIADILDNSISAGASEIHIDFGHSPEPYVSIRDDGWGMDADEAREAMRLAGNASIARSASDLGRFGLGLKTASLSQARSLLIISKKAGAEPVTFLWDLDIIAKTNRWTLVTPEIEPLYEYQTFKRFRAQETGTIVLWRKLDLLEARWGTELSDLDSAMAEAKRHIGLVFHRFIESESGPRIRIRLNYDPIEAIDPFLSSHRATQSSPVDRIPVRDSEVTVTAFTLPALTLLTETELKTVNAPGAPTETQGFYIYRAKRLVTWGTWFRLAPRSNLKRLTRVKVDVPNSLDDLWSLDVKKSQAEPPPQVRDRLRKLVPSLTNPSERVHVYRGRKARNNPIVHIWDVYENGDTFRYEVNREHPLLRALSSALGPEEQKSLSAFLNLLELGLPIGDIFNRLARDKVPASDSISFDSLVEQAAKIRTAMNPEDHELLPTILRVTEPFAGRDDIDKIVLSILD